MLNKPPPQVLRAMANLTGDPNHRIVLDWLKSELQRLRKNGDSIEPEVQLRRNQGASQTVDKLIEYHESSIAVLRNN